MPVSIDVVKEKYLVDFSILLWAKENGQSFIIDVEL